MSLEGLFKGIAIGIFMIFVYATLLQSPFYKSYQNLPPEINYSQLELDIHELINEERMKRNLTPLGWDQELSNIARRHSQDMASKNFFDHVNLKGEDFTVRYENAGYICIIPLGQTVNCVGAENIFQNNLYDRIIYQDSMAYYAWNSQGALASSTVAGWMDSKGHRENILAPFWRKEGIGIAVSHNDTVYITQNFC